MVEQKLTKEKLDALKEIKGQIANPGLEYKSIPIIKNSYKNKKKIINQYKIAIPTKFAYFLNMADGNYEAKATLDKEKNKLIIEIEKNEEK